MNTNDRRLMRVSIDVDLVIDMFRTGHKVEHGVECIDGLPPDAQYVGNSYDVASLSANFFFSHPSFEPVSPGHVVPIKQIYLRKFNSKSGV